MVELENPTEENTRNILDVWKGLGLAALLHLFQLFFFWMAFVPAWIIGVTQLAYILPAIAHFRGKNRPGIVQGLIIGAAITFLLNAACFGYLFMGGIRIGG
ncbi:MAG TPA: hypothetical protein VJ873_12900 [bacterium]|nr:hypothetical protein [bacterium]